MKKIVLVSMFEGTAELYRSQIEKIYNGLIEIETFALDTETLDTNFEADLVIITSYTFYGIVKKHLITDAEIIIANRILNKNGFEKIRNLKDGTKALMVNATAEVTVDTISMIYQVCDQNIELYPYYPGAREVPGIDIAITPNEMEFVPQNIDTVINIGDRVLGTTTIREIGLTLEIEDPLIEKKIEKYCETVHHSNNSFDKIVNTSNLLRDQFKLLMTVIQDGILVVKKNSEIYLVNDIVLKMINLERSSMKNTYLNKSYPELLNGNENFYEESTEGRLVELNGKLLIVDSFPMELSATTSGAIFRIREYSNEEKKQYKMRAKVLGKGHVAKYNFDDIIGNSSCILKTKSIAKRMAKSKSSILIIGESGTGKELFAQAIHNSSNQKKGPFVAVNCGAFPENLLESELFGYEEGAFTGAKKGGKPGLFELAHGGTLFLDEIGEMPLLLQTRLLRVLQERAVMRLGGDQIINVDIRIIAATNKDLKSAIRKGEFRQDLYYRLNVLPLAIPSLRERIDDLMPLIDSVMSEYGVRFELDQKLILALKAYSWEGNIRELRNIVEYFFHLGKEVVEITDLPYKLDSNSLYFEQNERIEIIERPLYFQTYEKETNECCSFIMDILYESYKHKKRFGRRTLVKEAANRSMYFTEQQIRKATEKLREIDMVVIYPGRGGTVISEKGIQFVNGHKGHNGIS